LKRFLWIFFTWIFVFTSFAYGDTSTWRNLTCNSNLRTKYGSDGKYFYYKTDSDIEVKICTEKDVWQDVADFPACRNNSDWYDSYGSVKVGTNVTKDKLGFVTTDRLSSVVCDESKNKQEKSTEKIYFGVVVDKETGEPLMGANIVKNSDANKGCATDSQGKFDCSKEFATEEYTVSGIVSYVGYKSEDIVLKIREQQTIELQQDNTFDAVEVVVCNNTEQIYDSESKVCIAACNYHIAHTDAENRNKQAIACCNTKEATWSEKDQTCSCPTGQKWENNECAPSVIDVQDDDKDTNQDTRTDEQKAADLKDKQNDYDEAKAREGSWENRLLTAATTAATGFGGMELAQGLAEQSADEAAAADMAVYIDTMRCTYGGGTSVRAGLTPVELPGGNNNEMMNLRIEYDALAESVKNRKESLGMAPGIESEVILGKAEMGLYDDENTGITGGKYSSLYRADMLNSGPDKNLIKSAQETSQNRVDYGGQAAGVGAIVGIVGNIAINGKLGDLFKNDKFNSQTRKLAEKEQDALADLKKCLKSAGVKNTDDLSFEKFYPSIVSVDDINCKRDLPNLTNVDASDLFVDSTNEYTIYYTLADYITTPTLQKMFGADRATRTSITNTIRESIESVKKKFQDALEQDEKAANKLGVVFGEISNDDVANGLQYLQKLKTK